MATDAVVERILGAANHFEVFDIPPVAVDAAVVTKLYRRLALKCHPDKCKHPDGPAAFRRLTAAHDSLSDPRQQKNHLGELADFARRDAAERAQRERAKRAAAAEAEAARAAAARAQREAEERALREARKADRERERELRKRQAEARAVREAAERAAAEEAARAEEARAKEEARRRAKALQKARRRLRNARAALAEELEHDGAADGGAADGERAGEGSAPAGADAPLTEAEVELLCARLTDEAELERVLVALLTGDFAAARAAHAAAARES